MANPIDRIGSLQRGQGQGQSGSIKRRRSTGFDQALERMLRDSPTPQVDHKESGKPGEIHFSRHAEARLQSRGIELTEEDKQQLSSAFDQLADRGAKESLVLTGDRAYVVGVPKRTVITAMSRSEALGTIFTNIDSTFVAS
jgi:flagellar operon protein